MNDRASINHAPPLRREDWAEAYMRVRAASEALCAPLCIEDYGVQSADFASPPKWHLAHVSWFFETFLLDPYLPGYAIFDPAFRTLFNSYYEQVGEFHPRAERGHLSRPTVEAVYRYRAHVDAAMRDLIAGADEAQWPAIETRLAIGLNHEQQHQELLLTDIKQHFSVNPLRPAYRADLAAPRRGDALPLAWQGFDGGLIDCGFDGEGFCYDNERPQHRVFLNPFSLANRLVTNANTSPSSMLAATAIRRYGCPMAGPRCSGWVGAAPAIGSASAATGMNSRWAACASSTSTRRSRM